MSKIMAERIDDMVIVLDNELTLDEVAKLRDQIDGCLMDYDVKPRPEIVEMLSVLPPVPKGYALIEGAEKRYSIYEKYAGRMSEWVDHQTRCENMDAFYAMFGCPPPGALGTRELYDICWKWLREVGYLEGGRI